MQNVDNQAIESSEVTVEEPIINTGITEEVEKAETKETDTGNIPDEGKDTDDDELGDDQFPKKAVRALERRNKKIHKYRSENAELKQKIAEYESQVQLGEQIPEAQQPVGINEPQEKDFENYADYLEAKGEYKVRKEYAAKEAQAQQQQFAESQQRWVQERAHYVNDRAAEAVKTIPELEGLYRENQDIIESYSDTTKLAFLEADKPELAFYALAQEGSLEALEGMSPTKVARTIALAELRGEKLAKGRPVSKTPAPIKHSRGSSPRNKTLDDMSPTELLNHLRKQKNKR